MHKNGMILNNVQNLIEITEALNLPGKQDIIDVVGKHLIEPTKHFFVEKAIKHMPNKIADFASGGGGKFASNSVTHIMNSTIPKLKAIVNKFNKPEFAEKLNEHHEKLSKLLSDIDHDSINKVLNSDPSSNYHAVMGNVSNIIQKVQTKAANHYHQIVKERPDISVAEAYNQVRSKLKHHIADSLSEVSDGPAKEIRRDLTKTEKGILYGSGALTVGKAAYDIIKDKDK